MRVLRACDDDLADMIAASLAPVPHKERVRSVIGIATAVHLYIARVIRKLAFIFLAQDKRVARLGQQAVEEFDVTGRGRDGTR